MRFTHQFVIAFNRQPAPITAISFNQSGSLMAYAVAYDWEKVATPLFLRVIEWYSDAISVGLFGHGGWSSQQSTHPPIEGGRDQEETKEVMFVVVHMLQISLMPNLYFENEFQRGCPVFAVVPFACLEQTCV